MMLFRPRTLLLWLIGGIVWALVALWVVAGNPMLRHSAPAHEPRHLLARAHVKKTYRGAEQATVHATQDAGRGFLDLVEDALKLAGVAAAAAGAVRLIARRRGRSVRLTLLPHRDETLTPAAVDELLRVWHGVLRVPRWRSALLGPRVLGLEIETAPTGDGRTTASLALVGPADLMATVAAAFRERCPDSRLLPAPATAAPPVTRRLRRPRHRRIVSPADSRERLLTLLATMTATGAPTRVQYVLVAANPPGGKGRAAQTAWSATPPDAPFEPTRGPVPAQVIGGGPVPVAYHVGVRVAGPTAAGCRDVAGAAAAAAGLVGDRVLGLRGAFTAPPWRAPRATSSSAELAGGWHLPGAGEHAPVVPRSAVPRLPAPARVSRDPGDALLRDEEGPVGLSRDALRGGLAILGGADAARAVLAERWLTLQATHEDRPMLVVATRPGGAAAARAVLDQRREVITVDLAEPSVGINPFAATGEPTAIGAAIAAGLGHPDDRVLRLTVAAVIAGARAGALRGAPAPLQAQRLLEADADRARDELARALYPRPRAADLAAFVGQELRAAVRDGSATPAVTALQGSRGWALDVLARAPQALSLTDVLRRRETVVVDASALEPADRGAVARLVLTGLDAALREIAPPGRSAQTTAALLVDGADAVIDGPLADTLAALRDTGLDVAATWRYAAPLAGDDERGRLLAPTTHRCALRVADGDDVAVAAAVCQDVLAADARVPARGALSARSALALPDGYALCGWGLDGGGRATFVARAG